MKKIYMILAAMTLLSMSLNAQIDATKKVDQTQQTAPTGKKVDTQLGVAKMALNPTHRAPARATETTTYSYTLPNNNAFSTAGGTAALGDVNWTYSAFTYKGWDNARGLQIGSRQNPTSTFTLSTSEIPGTITSITVGANAYNANATIRATVGGAAFGTTQNLSSGTSAATNTFTGSASGEIVITWTNVNNGRAMYFKSIEVTYETEAGDIATLDLFSNTTDVNMCLPVYGGYHDHTQHNQMVYPASLLTDMVGKKIKSMTFYPASVTYNNTTYSGIGFRNGSVTFKLMEVTNSTGFNSSNPSFITGSMTTVKTVTMPSSAQTSATTWKITFDQEYEYNGGDLVIDVTNATGDYQRTFFYTGTTSIAYPGYYTYSGSEGNASVAVDYVPKVTFTYEDSQPRHDLGITLSEPTAVTAGENATITATVTNHGNQTETGYTVTFSDGTNTFSTQTGGTLAPGATETFTATYTTSAAGTVTITANVACTGDADATNDEATTNLTVNAPVHDLGIALTATDEVVGGNDVTLTATVTNTGDLTETGYTVTFSDGTNTFSTQTGGTLAPGATETFTATYTTTAAQGGTTVTFTATVTCTGDADATNDEATASTAVILLPPPTNVVATPDGANATVTWNAPVIAPVAVTVTEDFEDTSVFPSFSTGGIDANTHTGAFGDWTLYDATGGCVVYGSKQLDYDNESVPLAWFVFKPSGATASEDYPDAVPHDVHSGAQYLESMCPTSSSSAAGVSDHWLISPELSGNAQTISFYVCELTTDYGSETYEIWVSTTDNDPSSFTKLGSTYTVNYTNWTEQTVQLPAGTKYFAIRHTSNDIFALLIDDVTYEAKLPGLQPISYNVYLDGVLEGNVAADAALTYNFSNLASGGHTASVSAVYPGGIESVAVPATFTILPTPNAPAVSSNDGTTSTTITITPDANTDGQLVYYVDYNGSQTQDLTFPRGETDYQVTVHAYTEATANYNQSPEAVVTVTIPALPQTPAPTIAISSQTDNEVTITATGNGTVILNIPGYEPVTGNGSASITVPRHMSDYVVTATATAQVSGELVSTTTTQNITVPGKGNDGWIEMTETYDNPNDLLSFKVKVGNDTTDIMMIDQFLQSTVFNDHPSSYTYVLKETKVINGVDSTMTSNPAEIPVYKTNSKIKGRYTEAQVLADDYAVEENRLTANEINSEMAYDANPDNNVLYYSLYRGGKDELTPVVDVDHRISQLQKYEEKYEDNEGEHVQYYFTENHLTGILPRYDHNDNIGNQTVERLDVNSVVGETGDKVSYVPVIWTFGLYTARGDGKNNSYGSDIKVNELGGVTVRDSIITNYHPYNTFKYNGLDYYVVAPKIILEAVEPELKVANDGDTYKYEPYMYRVWCTYPGARTYAHDGDNHLIDGGAAIQAPFPIGEAKAINLDNPNEAVIGGDLGHNAEQSDHQWSFAAPKSDIEGGNIQFVVRYYYKKVVTDADPTAQPSGMRGNRDSGDDYFIYETSTSSKGNIITGVNELWSDYGKVVISQTYVNAQGMQSDKPFDGLNIVVTRFSDGTTTTTKVVR